MATRKEIADSPMKLAALLTKMEGGTSEIKVADMRQAMKLMVDLDAALTVAGYKSALVMLRRKAAAKAKAHLAKKKKKV